MEQKTLSPSEKADLRKKRQIFNDLYKCFEETDFHTASAQLTEIESMLSLLFMNQDQKFLIKNLEHQDKVNDKGKYIFELFDSLTVSEGVTYLRALKNAIEQKRDLRIMDWKVKDLDIELLTTDI